MPPTSRYSPVPEKFMLCWLAQGCPLWLVSTSQIAVRVRPVSMIVPVVVKGKYPDRRARIETGWSEA